MKGYAMNELIIFIVVGLVLNIFLSILYLLITFLRISKFVNDPNKKEKIIKLCDKLFSSHIVSNLLYSLIIPYMSIVEISYLIQAEHIYKTIFGGNVIDFLLEEI